MTHDPRISFKRGDSFKLDITVTDPNNPTAVAAAAALAASQILLQAAIDADPYVEQDEIDAQAVVDADQATYDAAIIVDITDWVITSKLTWCGSYIGDLVVTITNVLLGTFTITQEPPLTQVWKIREHQMDILFVRSEGTTSSETLTVDVERGSTNG